MFVTFKMTAKRLFVITAAAVAVILVIDAVRMLSADEGIHCKNDTERVMYLKTQGLIADPDALWTKDTVIDEQGSNGWDEYARRLSKNGFDISDYYGSAVTVCCYALKQNENADYVRVLCCGDEVIGFDLSSEKSSA